MRNRIIAVICSILAVLALGACSTTPAGSAPDTLPGDQLQRSYMHGKWCTNREETAQRNKDANFSAMTNLKTRYWIFGIEGEWKTSSSGGYYTTHGSWQLEDPDKFVLNPNNGDATVYQAHFTDGGTNLVLLAPKGDFLVLERCD